MDSPFKSVSISVIRVISGKVLPFNFGDLWHSSHFWQLSGSSASSVPPCFKGFAFPIRAHPRESAVKSFYSFQISGISVDQW